MCDQKGDKVSPAAAHDDKVATFFQLSAALSLDQSEEQALLDLSEDELGRLHHLGIEALQLGNPKLERRLDYAIPILRRMLAARAS